VDSVLIPWTLACNSPVLTVVGTVVPWGHLNYCFYSFYHVTWVILYMCMYIAGKVTFLQFCLTVLRYSAISNLLRRVGYWRRACCGLDIFLFFFSPLCSVRGRTGEPGEVDPHAVAYSLRRLAYDH